VDDLAHYSTTVEVYLGSDLTKLGNEKSKTHASQREKIALGGKTQKCLDLADATVALWLPSVALVAGNPHGNNPLPRTSG
jgi:hypothetical protein